MTHWLLNLSEKFQYKKLPLKTLTPSTITKIAVVIPKYGLVGGGELFTFEVTEQLARNRQYDIHVFANQWRSGSKNITFHKVPIVSFPKWLTTISFAFFASKKIANQHFNLIHAYDRIFEADIFTMHGIPHKKWVSDVRKKNPSLFDHATIWVENCLVNSGRCKKFLAVSSLARSKFLEEYNVEQNKVDVLHPGVDLEKFNSPNKSLFRQKIRKQFQATSQDIIILFVSMNFELKGLETLLYALDRVSSENQKKCKILVVGKGNQKKFQSLANKLGLGQNIIFSGVWQKNIEHVYWAADFFVLLSEFDTFGMSVLEAMAASLPVIISDMVGAKDLVSQGKNGFVIKKNDISKISEKINTLLDKATREKMGIHAFETASRTTWDFNTQTIAKLWNTLTSSDPPVLSL